MRPVLTVLTLVWLIVVPCTAQEEGLSQMGLSPDEAGDLVLDSLFSATMPYQSLSRAFLAAPLATRMAWIREGFRWARAYTGSQSFLQEYQARRTQAAPGATEQTGSLDDELARQQREFSKQLEEMRQNLKQMPADLRPQLEQTIRDMEKQFKEQFENPEYRALMAQGHEMMKEERLKDMERQKKEFDKSHPKDPRTLIARQLKAFLRLSADVDFSAPTEMRDGLRKFKDPVHESKSREWKLLFRAGREAVAAAVVEAKAWLAKIPQELQRP